MNCLSNPLKSFAIRSKEKIVWLSRWEVKNLCYFTAEIFCTFLIHFLRFYTEYSKQCKAQMGAYKIVIFKKPCRTIF